MRVRSARADFRAAATVSQEVREAVGAPQVSRLVPAAHTAAAGTDKTRSIKAE